MPKLCQHCNEAPLVLHANFQINPSSVKFKLKEDTHNRLVVGKNGKFPEISHVKFHRDAESKNTKKKGGHRARFSSRALL